ncbi:polysaccharide deacetylase family protein [uncultured Umboniibacter sp.]|uniref:polysaccharide deacetylase family protein n=1 Tax=uncultured Umboniibacter sp. TaxID=1798917 RepID=UPI002615DE77|nr:polysaccharide deacetylase family protein [uncultured Umboniibacter sp.]
MLRLLMIIVGTLLSTTVNSAVILQYHHVSNDTPASTSISPEMFAAHMAYVEELGYEVVPLSELVVSLRNGNAIADDVVAITFDDGYADNMAAIKSEIVPRDWPFTIFVPPLLIDQRLHGYMSWDELNELKRLGGELSNHSWEHNHLAAKLPNESDEAWLTRFREDLLKAEARIEEMTGESNRILAYPYGEFSPQMLEVLSEEGFAAVGQQSGAVGELSELGHLPRFPFGGPYGTVEDFHTKVRTLAMPVESVVLKNKGEVLTSHILEYGSAWPQAHLTLQEGSGVDISGINCFASGLGVQAVTSDGEHSFSVLADGALQVGRSRYNCTAGSNQRHRFYWFSVPVVQLSAEGSWVD